MSSRITPRWRSTLTGLLIWIMLAMSGTGVSHAADNPDHERARQAVEAGDVLPLRTILDRVEREYPGQVMEVELDREKGGVLMKLKIHARDGTILDFKERQGKPHKPHDQGEPR